MNTDIRLDVTFKGHRKRRRLKALLGPEATDYLIDLWITAAQERPQGVLTGWDVTDIALAAGYPGDGEKLVSALLEAKLLDQDKDGTYKLHDWSNHQPWIVGTSDRREAARKAGIASAVARGYKSKAKINGRSTESNDPLNGRSTDVQPRTRTYTRTYTRTSNTPYSPPSRGTRNFLTKKQQYLFEQFWCVYPKKKSRGVAEKAFAQIDPDEQLLAGILAMIERAKTSDDWRKDGGKYIPYPATWLRAKGWLDVIEEGGVSSARTIGNRVPQQYTRPEDL